ncbi:GMC oxidoreductase [Legionella brunensis]|uniref:6'''-hydroxyparomomycin C oxidase n=1 Tax=Legionella brunensis TaxID=29422 RepID=A0A0W0SUH7_9GAMM|nr:GMC oxidoreductase [Legionella brunensis]KTC87047.1 6'''-hydroxyparomomycin C oxidase [Legionella brunensis]
MVHDVTIIGSGILGAICAHNLAKKGVRVLMLEIGAPISTPPGDHLRNQQKYQEHPDQFFDEIEKHCQLFDAGASPEGLPGANVTHAYGGQATLWTNNCPRPVQHEQWPEFDDMNMDEYLSRAENILHVQKDLFDSSIRQTNLLATLDPILRMQNRSLAKVPLAGRKRKNSVIDFTSTLQILNLSKEERELITIQMNTEVIELLHKKSNTYGLRVKQNKQLKDIRADVVIVAAGAFDTTQLLYNSSIHPVALGHYLHFHPLHLAQVVLNSSFVSTAEIVDTPPRTCIYPTPNYPWHAMILRDIFPNISREIINENELIDFQYFIPIDVQERNRMILSRDKPKFEVRLTDNDKQIMDGAMKDLKELASRLGRYRKGCEPMTLDFGFTHPMGMCRMGTDVRSSVTNLKGRVHGFNNLYLATVGLIPSKMAVNPTLTAAAIALITTDSIAE